MPLCNYNFHRCNVSVFVHLDYYVNETGSMTRHLRSFGTPVLNLYATCREQRRLAAAAQEEPCFRCGGDPLGGDLPCICYKRGRVKFRNGAWFLRQVQRTLSLMPWSFSTDKLEQIDEEREGADGSAEGDQGLGGVREFLEALSARLAGGPLDQTRVHQLYSHPAYAGMFERHHAPLRAALAALAAALRDALTRHGPELWFRLDTNFLKPVLCTSMHKEQVGPMSLDKQCIIIAKYFPISFELANSSMKSPKGFIQRKATYACPAAKSLGPKYRNACSSVLPCISCTAKTQHSTIGSTYRNCIWPEILARQKFQSEFDFKVFLLSWTDGRPILTMPISPFYAITNKPKLYRKLL
ncbi:hypothetical protein EVAR_83317_1 [Eumeta japonica]|uniref:Uncharacterized protein n=1 Tax=Eumeta variegata TaxID=151549 RepID=A0A4C1VW71_EUMVA|nr:hypothetical protein EVAR_83317_1 [Eumeta japonica]